MSSRAFVALVLAMLALSATMAAADESVAFAQYWNAEGSFSYANWPNLGDLVPAGRGGDFKTDGFGIEVKVDTSLNRLGSAVVFGGLALGLIGFNSAELFESDDFDDESSMDLIYFMPTLAFRFGQPGARYVDLDLGLGLYIASNKYIDCVAVPECARSELDVEKLGGFVGVSGAVWRGLTLGVKVHYADFGTVSSVGPDSGQLDGPIYALHLGWELSNWRK